MSGVRIRASILTLVCALTLLVGSSSTAFAQQNDQDGLVNVNLQNLQLEIPVSVAVPVGIAANVCNVSVLSLVKQDDPTCDAENVSFALSKAIANQMLETGGGGHGGGHGGGGANNDQDGLVNVNLQNLQLAVPVSVAVPVGVAANVCNVSVLSLVKQDDPTCDAENTSKALSKAIARQLIA